MVKVLSQNLIRFGNCNSEYENFWLSSRQIWHNAHCCCFGTNVFKKLRRGQNLSILRNKTIHASFWMQLFSELDSFWSFQLKIWLCLNFTNQNLRLCKKFESKADKCWKIWVKIWLIVNFVIQRLTLSDYPNSKSDTWWKFSVKIWYVVKPAIQNLTRCDLFHTKIDRL